VADGSLTDISAQLRSAADAKEVNAAFRAAAEGDLRGILAYSEEDLVSSDIIGDPHSAIIHSLSTRAQGNLVKVQAWYDNEYGYACRCLDLLESLPLERLRLASWHIGRQRQTARESRSASSPRYTARWW
jgi:glyceraldehyde-3-phosphate dehydrogenase/erythrose-4-phosphate dehydrogenase